MVSYEPQTGRVLMDAVGKEDIQSAATYFQNRAQEEPGNPFIPNALSESKAMLSWFDSPSSSLEDFYGHYKRVSLLEAASNFDPMHAAAAVQEVHERASYLLAFTENTVRGYIGSLQQAKLLCGKRLDESGRSIDVFDVSAPIEHLIGVLEKLANAKLYDLGNARQLILGDETTLGGGFFEKLRDAMLAQCIDLGTLREIEKSEGSSLFEKARAYLEGNSTPLLAKQMQLADADARSLRSAQAAVFARMDSIVADPNVQITAPSQMDGPATVQFKPPFELYGGPIPNLPILMAGMISGGSLWLAADIARPQPTAPSAPAAPQAVQPQASPADSFADALASMRSSAPADETLQKRARRSFVSTGESSRWDGTGARPPHSRVMEFLGFIPNSGITLSSNPDGSVSASSSLTDEQLELLHSSNPRSLIQETARLAQPSYAPSQQELRSLQQKTTTLNMLMQERFRVSEVSSFAGQHLAQLQNEVGKEFIPYYQTLSLAQKGEFNSATFATDTLFTALMLVKLGSIKRLATFGVEAAQGIRASKTILPSIRLAREAATTTPQGAMWATRQFDRRILNPLVREMTSPIGTAFNVAFLASNPELMPLEIKGKETALPLGGVHFNPQGSALVSLWSSLTDQSLSSEARAAAVSSASTESLAAYFDFAFQNTLILGGAKFAFKGAGKGVKWAWERAGATGPVVAAAAPTLLFTADARNKENVNQLHNYHTEYCNRAFSGSQDVPFNEFQLAFASHNEKDGVLISATELTGKLADAYGIMDHYALAGSKKALAAISAYAIPHDTGRIFPDAELDEIANALVPQLPSLLDSLNSISSAAGGASPFVILSAAYELGNGDALGYISRISPNAPSAEFLERIKNVSAALS
ncbi:hypothetical protein J4441_03395 [Candidatus Micrarchaeota archaeon]|nr:hypothetical protein [Candidatus Micrarchaeota archaeon]